VASRPAPKQNPLPKIAKDVLILVVTMLLILFFGSPAWMFANYYVSPRFGVVAGFVCAVAASLAVGYLVNRGVGKIFGR
jgi:polyferredoxin